MYSTQGIYNVKNLLKMLDIALTKLACNEICDYCNNVGKEDYICVSEYLCKSYLFEGIAQQVKWAEEKEKTKYELKPGAKTDFGMSE